MRGTAAGRDEGRPAIVAVHPVTDSTVPRTRHSSGRAARLARPDGGPLRDPSVIPPWSMRESPCEVPSGPVYCSRASGAGTPLVTLSEGSPLAAPSSGRVSSPPSRRAFPLSGSPRSALPIAALAIRKSIARMDAKQVWRAALGELQVSLSPANFETWLRDTYLVDVDDQRFRIAVPNGFAKDWLETRYRSLISQTLARVVGYSVQVEFVVQGATEVQAQAAAIEKQPVRVEPTRVGAPEGAAAGATNLNPRYHFSNFIVGSANRLAHAASLSVAERPGPRLQPAVPVRRRRPRQDAPDARHRQRRRGEVPAQAGRVRDVREVHQRVHHLDPAGQDRRVPRPLPPDRPAPHRRHPVHRGQGADAGRVLPHVQRDPRGRQADRPQLGPAAEGDPDARGAAPLPLRVGPDRGPHRAGPRDADRDPAGQGRGAGRRRSPPT